MSDANPPHPAARWRQPPPAAGAAPVARPGRGARRAAALVALLAVAGAVTGMYFWLKPIAAPKLVTIPVCEYTDHLWPANPWAERDSRLLCACFPHYSQNCFDDQERDRLRMRLESLGGESGRPLVLHISALAAVHKGQVYLLPADAVPGAPDRWLPVEEVLRALAGCPAPHKLLLLDVARPLAAPFGGPLRDATAERLHERLSRDDLPCPVLCSCSPGEFGLPLEDGQLSAFVHYIVEGLRGAADGSTSAGERDDQVSARELAAFVTARVSRWAERARGARQTPRLYGPADDFTLTHAPWPAAGESAPPPSAYPAWLLTGWQRRDGWWADDSFRAAPAAFGHLEFSLLRAERAWEAGQAERAAARFGDELAGWQAALDAAKPANLLPPLPPRSLAAARLGRPEPPPELRKALDAYLELRAAAPPKPEEIKKHRDAFLEKSKAQSTAAAALVWDRLLEIPLPAADTLRDTSALFQDVLTTPFTETLLVRRLAAWDPLPWPAAEVHSLLLAEDTAERTLTLLPAGFPWVRQQLDDAEKRRRDGEARLLRSARAPAALAEAQTALEQAERDLRDVRRRLEAIQSARQSLEAAVAVLVGAVPVVVDRDGGDLQDWERAARVARTLADRLARPPAAAAPSLAEWDGPSAELRGLVQRLERPYAPAAVKKAVAAAKEGGLPEHQALRELLRGPLLKAPQRKEVWEAARGLAHRLHEDVQKLDDADDDARRPTPPPRAAAPDGAEDERAARRARVSAGLLLLAGLDGVPDPGAAARRAEQGGDAAAELADALRDAWINRLPRQVQDRAARQDWPAADRLARVPGPQRDPAAHPERPPASRRLRQELKDYRQWLAGRYGELSKLRGGVPGAAAFYEEAADDCLHKPPRD